MHIHHSSSLGSLEKLEEVLFHGLAEHRLDIIFLQIHISVVIVLFAHSRFFAILDWVGDIMFKKCVVLLYSSRLMNDGCTLERNS
ncbi:hypothetical protein BT63DRAFT_36052 [Microthyrium microscopicum]|uniref:Uncharacterized protein n=1 Tax=Microthyrium microscopicum TaxID=703497 RepID=A0A6A6UWN0_9PEZI|nr:hypothetical protein BT63DRAFT_36052 [Microthyrium microscopicum]